MTADKNELLNIVDENDQVIGEISKNEAHKKGILHREVAVILFSGKEVLLQQRSYDKKYFPGKWSLTVTGHVPSGIAPLDAAKTELMEELGINCDLEFVNKKKYTTGEHQSIGYLFFGYIPRDTNIIVNKNELKDAKFFTLEKYKELLDHNEVEPHSAIDLNKYWVEPFSP